MTLQLKNGFWHFHRNYFIVIKKSTLNVTQLSVLSDYYLYTVFFVSLFSPPFYYLFSNYMILFSINSYIIPNEIQHRFPRFTNLFSFLSTLFPSSKLFSFIFLRQKKKFSFFFYSNDLHLDCNSFSPPI